MFPDFPRVKRHIRKLFTLTVRRGIIESEPMLDLVSHTTQHEGRSGRIARADQTSDAIDYQRSTGNIEIPIEQMRSTTLETLLQHALGVGRQIAEQQAKSMFDLLNDVTSRTGNVFDSSVDPKSAFLQMEDRILTEFDPETRQPINQVLVIHPSEIEVWRRRLSEWEKDPEFVAARERVRQRKLEEWSARENSRRLAD